MALIAVCDNCKKQVSVRNWIEAKESFQLVPRLTWDGGVATINDKALCKECFEAGEIGREIALASRKPAVE